MKAEEARQLADARNQRRKEETRAKMEEEGVFSRIRHAAEDLGFFSTLFSEKELPPQFRDALAEDGFTVKRQGTGYVVSF